MLRSFRVAIVPLLVATAFALLLPALAGAEPRAQVPDLSYRLTIPALSCHGCEEPSSPQAPTNARLNVERCGLDATCDHEESQLRITVTYLWPAGDPATGFVEEFHAQTCIRAWAEPTTLRQTVSGYAFGGDCSTNASGTTDEFFFTAPGPVLFCAQVDAFIFNQDLGSSNLACLEVTPPPD